MTKILTPREEMKLGYLYNVGPHIKDIVEVIKIAGDKIWIQGVAVGEDAIFYNKGYVYNTDNNPTDLQFQELGPKEDYPEYFL